jgi:energy-coupling factor transporter ATP-binding protein EcfA2/predicted transcriptional regulator
VDGGFTHIDIFDKLSEPEFGSSPHMKVKGRYISPLPPLGGGSFYVKGMVIMASIGERLRKEGLVTEQDLENALKRQREKGGRLGQNLVALGIISEADLNRFLNRHPVAPTSLEDTGISVAFIADLIMKHIYSLGEFKLADVVDQLKLPVSLVHKIIEMLKKNRMIEITGGGTLSSISYNYKITELGKNRGSELMDLCRYMGPAPVSLEAYSRMVAFQTVKHVIVSEDTVMKAFSNLVLSESLLKRLGPAISSGKAIFVYGPSGNGKTAIAETIGALLPETVYIPYAITVGGQVILMFDPVTHIPADTEADITDIDQRWIKIKRPVVMTGGELTLKMLDLDFNPISKFYEASLQMKANNGLFIADDFGRQLVEPQALLNRWIVPLDRQVDFMTLHTGMKFEIPFDMLIIFSTNLEPKSLGDEAFLRRIRYKINIELPTEEVYETIFKKVCEKNAIPFDKKIFEYLIQNYYRKYQVGLNGCHPRDIIDHIIDSAHYHMHAPILTQEGIDAAWRNYFVDML